MDNIFNLQDIALVVILTMTGTASAAGWIASEIHQRRESFWAKKYYRVVQESFKVEEENRRLSSHFDARVEKEVTARISSWQPEPSDAEADFQKAELMAAKRERVNVGRSHPPRPDGGAPAVVHRMTFPR